MVPLKSRPERDSPYWIGAYVDVDQDGKPGANDPSAWYSGNPIMGNADTSGVITRAECWEDNRQWSTRHCHTDIGDPQSRMDRAILNNGRSFSSVMVVQVHKSTGQLNCPSVLLVLQALSMSVSRMPNGWDFPLSLC